jgi:bacteriocin biosynthesis cyclodehydratase domain-containing protein
MPTFKLRKPRLPSHYYVRFEPPDGSGDEVLVFTSERRKLKIKGHSFREFVEGVIPLLDGEHTLEEIQSAVSDLFSPDDLEASLRMLAEHHLLEDTDQSPLDREIRSRIEPQLNFFHELEIDPAETQQRLSKATVTIVGLTCSGAAAALSLAASHVGTIRCIDSLAVALTDLNLVPVFDLQDVGTARVEAVRRKIAAVNPKVDVVTRTEPLETDAAVFDAVHGSDFIICCADAGQSSVFYKLNRTCLQEGIPWTSASVSALEGIIGPTVIPGETPCYLCYKMRAVACADNPEDEFSQLRFLDRRKQDDSGRRENHVFGVGIVGNLLGLEAFKVLTSMPAAAAGRIVIIDFLELTTKKHVVLRKPWCPACFLPQRRDAATAAPERG